MLFSIVIDPNISASELNHDLELINQWAHQWKMAFNPDPTKQATEMLFSCKRNNVDHPPLFFNGFPVKRVSEHTQLGLTIEPSITFTKHIHGKISKAKRNIGLIKHLNRFLPYRALNQMYNALARSHLDYCDIIFHIPEIFKPPLLGSLTGLMEDLEKVQYQAGLAVSGAWKGTSRIKLYNELGWESLSDRRLTRRVLQLHKIIDKKSPVYLFEKLPPNHCVLVILPYVFQDVKSRTASICM